MTLIFLTALCNTFIYGRNKFMYCIILATNSKYKLYQITQIK